MGTVVSTSSTQPLSDHHDASGPPTEVKSGPVRSRRVAAKDATVPVLETSTVQAVDMAATGTVGSKRGRRKSSTGSGSSKEVSLSLPSKRAATELSTEVANVHIGDADITADSQMQSVDTSTKDIVSEINQDMELVQEQPVKSSELEMEVEVEVENALVGDIVSQQSQPPSISPLPVEVAEEPEEVADGYRTPPVIFDPAISPVHTTTQMPKSVGALSAADIDAEEESSVASTITHYIGAATTTPANSQLIAVPSGGAEMDLGTALVIENPTTDSGLTVD